MGFKPRLAASRIQALLATAAASNEAPQRVAALEEIARLTAIPGIALEAAAVAARTEPSAAVADIIGTKNIGAAMRWNLIWAGFSVLGLLGERKAEATAICVELGTRHPELAAQALGLLEVPSPDAIRVPPRSARLSRAGEQSNLTSSSKEDTVGS